MSPPSPGRLRRLLLPFLLVPLLPLPAPAQDAPATQEARWAALAALNDADAADRHGEAAERARACLAWLTDRQWRVSAARMGVKALAGLGDWPECIKMCDTFDSEARVAPHDADWLAEERDTVAPLRGQALVRVGRAAEAVAVLGEAVRLRPSLLDDPEIRLALVVARAEGRLTVDPDYRGKYAGDPRLADARRRMERSFVAAVDRVRRRLGLGDPGFPPVGVLLQDAAAGNGATGTVMATLVLPRGAERVGVLMVTTEPLVTGAWPEERILAHEMTHVLGRVLGPSRRSPDWVEEGLAHWVSCVDTSELASYVVDAGALSEGREGADPVAARLASVAALGAPGPYEQRVAGMALFHMLERVRGRGASVALAHRLLSEPDWRTAFAEEAKRPLEDLLPEVRAAWRKWREENLADAPALAAAARIGRGGNPLEGLKSVEEVLARQRGRALDPAASWIRARLLPARDGDRAAIEALFAIRRDHPGAMDVQVYARLDEAALLLRSGRKEAAADLAREVLRDWTWQQPGLAETARRLLREAGGR